MKSNPYEDLDNDELVARLTDLEEEKGYLERYWMVEDEDDEWGEVNRELDMVKKVLARRTKS